MKYPFIKVGHRNGSVFLRIVYAPTDKFRKTTMVRLEPHEASLLAADLTLAGWQAANGGKRTAKKLRIAKV